MFAKSRVQAFTYYNEFDRADRWRDDFAELKAGGFQFVVFRDGFDLRNQLASEDQTDRVKEMIGAAADAGLRSILHIGNPKALYLLPDTRAWRLDYVRRVSEVFGSCKGLYALQLEDGPTGGSEYPEDRWQQVMESVEGRLLTMEMTEDGYRHGRRIWQMEQYALYTAEVARAVKKVKSNLKTTMAFHLDALLPAETLVHFQHTARAGLRHHRSGIPAGPVRGGYRPPDPLGGARGRVSGGKGRLDGRRFADDAGPVPGYAAGAAGMDGCGLRTGRIGRWLA